CSVWSCGPWTAAASCRARHLIGSAVTSARSLTPAANDSDCDEPLTTCRVVIDYRADATNLTDVMRLQPAVEHRARSPALVLDKRSFARLPSQADARARRRADVLGLDDGVPLQALHGGDHRPLPRRSARPAPHLGPARARSGRDRAAARLRRDRRRGWGR